MTKHRKAHHVPEFVTGDPRNAAARVQAVQGRRRSNAASRHNPIPRQFRTRTGARRAAINDSKEN